MNACSFVVAPALPQVQPAVFLFRKSRNKQVQFLHCAAAGAARFLHLQTLRLSIPLSCRLPSNAAKVSAPFSAPKAGHTFSSIQTQPIFQTFAIARQRGASREGKARPPRDGKNFWGAGFAAAGAAALIAGALNSDAAECEPASEQADSSEGGGERRQLYPPNEPHTSGYLRVSDLHKIYWEECGNLNGHPVIFLHGGPGAGTAPINRRFFDPEFYRIILVDQRGAGKSLPHASLVDNTTWHLVEDLEKLREILKIDKWLVFGGSWGSTLSLAYAETHPERVVGLVLRGIFMIRRHEINWFYQRGADHIFPDAWEAYRDFIPPEERSGMVAAYHRRLMNDKDPETQIAAARAWTAWEMSTAYLRPSKESKERGEDDKFALAFARIENHYFVNGGFFPSDSWLLDNVPKIRHIPAVIIQGRYDVVCPMTSAWDLHRAWPEAEFRVVPDAGHSANEVGIGEELVAATERFKRLFADHKAAD